MELPVFYLDFEYVWHNYESHFIFKFYCVLQERMHLNRLCKVFFHIMILKTECLFLKPHCIYTS